jgi:hypothetical protein
LRFEAVNFYQRSDDLYGVLILIALNFGHE